MPRLLFQKTGTAVWISHLDLMRLFQRSFKRAGLSLTHSHGFNPRPQVSIALPLSVGISSDCELLDFDLDGDMPSMDYIRTALNETLVPGIRVLEVYEDGRKIRDLALLRCVVELEYDRVIPENTCGLIQELFCRDSLPVEKRSKNGVQDQDIIPLIRSLHVDVVHEHSVCLQALICCQNPSLNPMQLAAAMERHLPELKPDYVKCHRLEIYDSHETIFR